MSSIRRRRRHRTLTFTHARPNLSYPRSPIIACFLVENEGIVVRQTSVDCDWASCQKGVEICTHFWQRTPPAGNRLVPSVRASRLFGLRC